MSLFKKKKKETEVITFSVEDARAMVEGKYNDTLKEVRSEFWENVKKMQWTEKHSTKTMNIFMTAASHAVSARIS